MKLSVSEAAKLTGISVRTLHYYDQIGLLSPSIISSDTGYRYYEEPALERLQQILFYRELDFPLKEILQIMSASGYNKKEALKRQRELLQLKRQRMDQLIQLIDSNLKGEENMSFEEFDTSKIDQAKQEYAKEVKERWGNTSAYAQSQKKTAKYSKEDWAKVTEKMDEILKKFANLVGTAPEAKEVQVLVEEWKQYITEYYYDCTNEILAGLGQMYVADERFTKNMDKFKEGTTELISQAIEVYCQR